MNTCFNHKRNMILFYALVVILLLITLFPFIYTFSASFQSELTIRSGESTLIPKTFTLDNYKELLSNKSGGSQAFSMYIFNSLKVAIGTGLLTIIVSVTAAYGLARFQFKGREVISRLMLFLYVFPTILSIYPIYSILSQVNLINTHAGLILVHTTLVAPFCAWLLRSFFSAIPKEIEEAARVDGANRLTIIVRILLPLSAPGLLAAGIYAMISSWGEFMFASILIDSGTLRTIPVALAGFMSYGNQNWGLLLAGSILNVLPLLICFCPLLKTFLKGFTAGAVKG